MNDDFRVHAQLRSSRDAQRLADRLEEGDLEHEVADRVIVSVDDADVFLYAGTRSEAERAQRALQGLIGRLGFTATTELRRWHPEAEEWEDVEAPLPATESERAQEHAELVAQERLDSRRLGIPEFEVRVGCESHRDTVALAARLEEEGLEPIRRWRFLLIGAADEDAAQALAQRLLTQAPAGSTVTVQATVAAVQDEAPSNPFAVFGGLGG